MQENSFKVSALVSTYNCERFLHSRILNLLNQSIESIEIIVIDSGSEQNEAGIVEDLQQQFPNRIVYERTEREGLYSAWNRAARMSKGQYLISANSDDRLELTGLEKMVSCLDSDPAKALVYGDIYFTSREKDIIDFRSIEPINSNWKLVSAAEYSHKELMLNCMCGPQPLWRRSMHDQFGYFDESFTVAGDYDFWLRIAEVYDFIHLPEAIGLCLHNRTGITWSNEHRLIDENLRIRKRAMGFR